MKTRLCLLFLIPLGLLLAGCRTASHANATPLAGSMKGYELYSLQQGDHWVFSLLAGTNREKTLDEIKSPDAMLPDLNALISMLDKLPAGQYVTWSSRETLSLPANDIMEQVKKVCEDKGLILNIAK